MPREYDPEDDSPEARLFRRDADREAEWGRFTAMRVDMLLGGLTPLDAHRHVIPWEEVVKWCLKRR